jgi:hypothetical protein
MISNPTLWRVEYEGPHTEPLPAALFDGLRLHVVHSQLISVAMRIGERQRSYVVLDGCAGCVCDRCRLGCPAALFRRLLDSLDAGLILRAVAPPQGLARRPYTRSAFGWPGSSAEVLDSAVLEPWEDARLAIYWRRYGSAICCSTLLLTGETGPDPRDVLHAHGWRACAAPAPMLRRWSEPAIPPTLPFGRPWQAPLFLLLPRSGAGILDDPETEPATASEGAEG